MTKNNQQPRQQATIGIIGAGNIGKAIATALAKNGIEATLSNSRGPESLEETVAALGPTIKAGTREDAARADIVFVAVTWSKLPTALEGLPDWAGRTVVDANNPVEGPQFEQAELNGRTSSEVVASLVPGARVVKAFNHLLPARVAGDPASEGGKRVLFIAGDDADAKAEVAALIERLGFAGVDLGDLVTGGRNTQFPGGPLTALDLVKLN